MQSRGRRLDLVRQRLLASDPAQTQVTSVAVHYGFWELGRFARACRLRFRDVRPKPSGAIRSRPIFVKRWPFMPELHSRLAARPLAYRNHSARIGLHANPDVVSVEATRRSCAGRPADTTA